ncbi:hypothetical protein KAFR_0H02720 [Kazachstania africana CBS 2517]|uniref:Spindle pole component 29 n=1 Tax=Kazachstania africana (strain ATCC 22294 / BCRC 22015 / CBS 2517 / CECT 1963 / NBRC 1671 / NRRL Y-8276) TaxID=1071382 RepID=H2AZC5_KAZAF|nr:hypothetical protein KAFR_0H02720 [Kazachstania africana CBS 2517]CCF59681.1 hypothetical protein KAFR_0H02720 [Kazachstania africana CBS 2517]
MSANDTFTKDFFNRASTQDSLRDIMKESEEIMKRNGSLQDTTVFNRSKDKLLYGKNDGYNDRLQTDSLLDDKLRQQLRGNAPLPSSRIPSASTLLENNRSNSQRSNDMEKIIDFMYKSSNEIKLLKQTVHDQSLELKNLKNELGLQRQENLNLNFKIKDLDRTIRVNDRDLPYLENNQRSSSANLNYEPNRSLSFRNYSDRFNDTRFQEYPRNYEEEDTKKLLNTRFF